ncbi:hypothetical protein QTP88_027406 [Uroleucon formosanum]
MIKDLEESCEMSKSLEVDSLQQLCTQYSYQAYNFLSEISSNKEHVMKIIDQPKNSYRSKRGLINLVGRVANVLFGVCDDTDAEYFYSKIRDLESSNSRISKSSDAQIQIMQSIISNVNSSLLEINKNEINLADKYNFLLHEMQTEKAAIGTLNFKTALEERISLLNIILTQYAFETGNLLNIINMALQGFVHSSILDTNTFKNQLKDIKAQLPIGEGIPIDLDNSGISELLRLITTNIVYIENVLIFVIEIPLVNSYEFILYKNIPLPVNIYGNDYVMIAPKSDYIAIDKSRLYYLELSEIQISKCKQMMNMLLCTYDQQLHHLDESCELTVFRKPGILPNSCNLKNVNFNFSIWHRLDNTNSWIYVTIRDNIIIKCKNNSETIVVSINGTGILDLDNQCEANTDDGTLLIAKRKITTKMYKDFIPQLDTSINWKTKLDITNIILNNSIIPNKGALYSPPHHNISNATFTDYFNTIKNNFIIGGDYNAKHNAWGCRTNNPRGIVLYNFVNANNFNVLAPPGPTYWPSSPAKNPDILDIFETKIPSNLHCLTKNILELNSDHSSVILNVSATVFARVEPPRLFSPLTDRLEFQNIINQRIDLKIKLKSNYDIDEAVNNLTMLIQSATWEATKPNKTHDSKNNYPIVSDQIRCLIVEKRRARAKYQVTRLPSHKTAYNKLANLLKKVLAKYKSYEFEQKLHSLSVIDGSLWRETKRLLKYKTASPHC